VEVPSGSGRCAGAPPRGPPAPRPRSPGSYVRSSPSLPGRGDDDLSSGVSLFEIADRLRGLTQGIRPVDDRRDRAGLDELLQSCQIPLVRSRRVIGFGRVTGDPLAYEP